MVAICAQAKWRCSLSKFRHHFKPSDLRFPLARILELARTEQIEVKFKLKFTYGTIIGIGGLWRLPHRNHNHNHNHDTDTDGPRNTEGKGGEPQPIFSCPDQYWFSGDTSLQIEIPWRGPAMPVLAVECKYKTTNNQHFYHWHSTFRDHVPSERRIRFHSPVTVDVSCT